MQTERVRDGNGEVFLDVCLLSSQYPIPVGASLLAKIAQAPRSFWMSAVVLAFSLQCGDPTSQLLRGLRQRKIPTESQSRQQGG